MTPVEWGGRRPRRRPPDGTRSQSVGGSCAALDPFFRFFFFWLLTLPFASLRSQRTVHAHAVSPHRSFCP